MTSQTDDLAVDRRIAKIAQVSKGPSWLREAVALIAREAASIDPIDDDRSQLPQFIYRH